MSDSAAPGPRPPASGWLGRLRQGASAPGHNLVWLLHPGRWASLLVAAVLLLLWLTDRPLPAPGTGVQRLAEAEWAQLADRPPLAQTLGPRVRLPHIAEFSRGNTPPEAPYPLYRLRLAPPTATPDRADAPLMAVWLPEVCGDVELYLNGQLIHRRGTLDARTGAGACRVPLLATLPPALLQADAPVLDVRLAAQAPGRVARSHRSYRLGPVHIGPLVLLEQQHQHALSHQRDATQTLMGVAAVTGLAALALAAGSQLGYLAYFGAAALGWAGLQALLAGLTLPGPPVLTELLLATLPAPVAAAAILFLLRYCGLRLAWLEASLGLQCLIVPISVAALSADRLYSVAHTWPWILALEVAVALLAFLLRAWRYSRADFQIGAVALGAMVLAGLHEAMRHPDLPYLAGRQAVAAALVTLLAGIAWRLHLLARGALAAAEQARAEAEQRVIDASSHMEQSVAQMAELRIEQVTAKERKRIAADLHDDLGAKLLTIVHTSESERIATLAREALEEMRLSVRGLTGRAMQLGDAIGDWRSEVMSRMSQGGVELTWNTPDELMMSERALSARAYVQTTRILREAVSNVLKHSGASHSEVTIRQDLNDFELTISDNGKGIPTEMDGRLDRGHGMSTMKGRAKQLQGQCLVESGPGYGTTIRLTLPL